MRGLCHVVYWLGLVLWTASLVTAGLTAMVVFSRLGDVPLALDEFAAWPAEQHGRIAAGLTMADVFFVMNDSNEAIRARVTFRTAGPLEEWDPATGEVRPAPAGGSVELGVYHGKVYRSVKK